MVQHFFFTASRPIRLEIIVCMLSIRVSFVCMSIELDSTYKVSIFVNSPYFFYFPFALKLCSKVAKKVDLRKPITNSFSITFFTSLYIYFLTP